MPIKPINIVLYLTLLSTAICGAACSSTNAQPTKPSPAPDKTEVSKKSTYEPPKRVSKDVISSDDKASKKPEAAKAKK